MNSLPRDIQNTLQHWSKMHRDILRPACISVSELTCLTYIYLSGTETAWTLFNYGIYSSYPAVLRCVRQLLKKGYIDKNGINYYLTGKGELLILKFADFLKA